MEKRGGGRRHEEYLLNWHTAAPATWLVQSMVLKWLHSVLRQSKSTIVSLLKRKKKKLSSVYINNFKIQKVLPPK